ncbi:hypothetical protein PsorP6_014506 [Peronosclerospora sorghi]|uniref:Uncharacterized protein n=1 Tax=Peronosclerospora sorghi TaxID=230839 RepID=A0ACC0VUC3_9STRA|nr:hypothetical protein PsorP6_014506 [Peronosclerospora sorghi]
MPVLRSFNCCQTRTRLPVHRGTLARSAGEDPSSQPEKQVQASLSLITALQSFLMVPMQLGSGTMFTHFEVMYGIMLLPLTIFCFASSTYFPTTVLFTRSLYNAVSQAIFNPARQFLWLPFQENERIRFQNFVSGPVRSLSRIVGAVLTMVLTTSFVVELVRASCSR